MKEPDSIQVVKGLDDLLRDHERNLRIMRPELDRLFKPMANLQTLSGGLVDRLGVLGENPSLSHFFEEWRRTAREIEQVRMTPAFRDMTRQMEEFGRISAAAQARIEVYLGPLRTALEEARVHFASRWSPTG